MAVGMGLTARGGSPETRSCPIRNRPFSTVSRPLNDLHHRLLRGGKLKRVRVSAFYRYATTQYNLPTFVNVWRLKPAAVINCLILAAL